jgi:hypothetical protein
VGVLAQDATTLGTPFAFADERIVIGKTSNVAIPALINGAGYAVSKSPGVRLARLQISGVVQVDRGLHTVINQAFGPRTAGQVLPYVMNVVPYSGGAVIGYTGVYLTRLRLYSAFSVGGGQQMVRFQLSGVILDPDNFYTAPTLTVPAYVGVAGLGISPFARCSFNNDAGTPTVYDLVRSFDFAISNGDDIQNIQPAMKNVANRIAAGWTPSQIAGALNLGQLRGATNSVPLTDGVYPVDILIPSGDGSKTLTVAGSYSYSSENQSYAPTDFNTVGASYDLFGTSGTSTVTAVWPIVASYV